MSESETDPCLGPRFESALVLAARLHRDQVRKGTRIPYVAHLLAVASLALEHGAYEDEAIAALLHDAVEDQGGDPTFESIRNEFGERVASLVLELSDARPARGEEKPPWRVRKERYLEHLDRASPSVRMLAAADKLHNLRAIVEDLRVDGDCVWERFNASRSEIVWYYREIVRILAREPRTRLSTLLEGAFRELEAEAERPASSAGAPKPDTSRI